MAEPPLIAATRAWVVEHYRMNHYHLENTLEWLLRLEPNASQAMQLAALTHDMERAFEGDDKPVHLDMGGDDAEYYRLHSARSARIVGEFLGAQGADAALIEEVKRLIVAHEIGGWHEANLIQAADSLSFFTVNVDLFVEFIRTGKHTVEQVLSKLDFTLNRIQVPAARELAMPMYQVARERILALQQETP